LGLSLAHPAFCNLGLSLAHPAFCKKRGSPLAGLPFAAGFQWLASASIGIILVSEPVSRITIIGPGSLTFFQRIKAQQIIQHTFFLGGGQDFIQLLGETLGDQAFQIS
jgi:hypothetical protein